MAHAWLRLAPVLLLRHDPSATIASRRAADLADADPDGPAEVPDDRANPIDPANTGPTPTANDLALGRKMVDRRVQLAEKEQWSQLLQDCFDDVRHAQASTDCPSLLDQPCDKASHGKIVEFVLRDNLRAALSLLRGSALAPPTPATVAEVQNLMCLAPGDNEDRAYDEALTKAKACQAPPIPMRVIKSRLRALAARRAAGPGPSGWRN